MEVAEEDLQLPHNHEAEKTVDGTQSEDVYSFLRSKGREGRRDGEIERREGGREGGMEKERGGREGGRGGGKDGGWEEWRKKEGSRRGMEEKKRPSYIGCELHCTPVTRVHSVFHWRAGASQPSRTTGAIFLYISLRTLHIPYIST